MNEHVWSVILAGGEGERTRPFIKRWLGCHKPKQYCRFVGTRSLFQHTVDRADRLTPPERRVAVIARSHQAEALSQMENRAPGRIILQPHNCGTAAGIYLPLTYITAADPEATVVFFPSDHFVFPEEAFISSVRNALAATGRIGRKLVLLGATPDTAEQDYGWILPGNEYSRFHLCPLKTVRGFHEKPGPAKSEAVRQAGGLWNTFIVVARASVLWRLGWYLLPELMAHFEWIRRCIGTARELDVLEDAYQTMPIHDFSTQVLERAPRELAVMEMNGIYWSDWGRPERIQETLSCIGKQPLFPVEVLTA